MYEVFGDEPLVIELDLGAGFDITRPNPEDQDTVAEWVVGVRAQLNDAGVVAEDDPLMLAVELQLQRVMQAYGLSDQDEDGNDIPFVDEDEMFLCPGCKSVTTGELRADDDEYVCPVCQRVLTEDDLTLDWEDTDGAVLA